MLALAIEFSRCPKVRTLKAEQRDDAGRHPDLHAFAPKDY
jgi:hypothetical protein